MEDTFLCPQIWQLPPLLPYNPPRTLSEDSLLHAAEIYTTLTPILYNRVEEFMWDQQGRKKALGQKEDKLQL